jgi:hypothetical protein
MAYVDELSSSDSDLGKRARTRSKNCKECVELVDIHHVDEYIGGLDVVRMTFVG